MYIIIGGDQKEYGPITADDVRQWIAEGRLNEHSQVKAEGDAAFRPLAGFPEFAGAFAAKTPMSGTPPAFAGSTNWDERDYELDMGGCISRGWNLLKNNFGLLFVTALIFALIEGFIAGLGAIPIVGMLFSIVNLIITGPLLGGLYYVFIQTIRSQPAEVGDVFAGFRKAFAQLFLGRLVPALLAGACLIPLAIVLIIEILPLAAHGQLSNANSLPAISTTSAVILVAAFFVCVIGMIYLQIGWAFTLPLVMDKEMDFWTAMGTSRKMVNKHWWRVFFMMLLVGLVNMSLIIIGIIITLISIAVFGLSLTTLCIGVVLALICGLGTLLITPVGFAALMFAYETIFSEGQAA